MKIVTLAERPDLASAVASPEFDAWPRFLNHDQSTKGLWRRLLDEQPEYQLALLDDDRPIALASSAPFHWDGADDLPTRGVDHVAETCFSGHAPNAASAIWIVVSRDRLGTGLSRVMVEAMRDTAANHGLPALYAPVRPTWKPRYPLTPMAEYITWRKGDLPFDPWLRVHARLGGTMLNVCDESMLVTGTTAEWEEWTDLPMPSDGRYIVPGGLVPVEVENGQGRYAEPNIWVKHTTKP
ncbi:hypothetical protein [Spirillospora sp. CA-294931]|uniref:hypothetical protein n=1 Tax=Spirillospora sp. CA-294931 TaxID=3240042 RepID=UPI003D89DA74